MSHHHPQIVQPTSIFFVTFFVDLISEIMDFDFDIVLKINEHSRKEKLDQGKGDVKSFWNTTELSR